MQSPLHLPDMVKKIAYVSVISGFVCAFLNIIVGIVGIILTSILHNKNPPSEKRSLSYLILIEATFTSSFVFTILSYILVGAIPDWLLSILQIIINIFIITACALALDKSSVWKRSEQLHNTVYGLLWTLLMFEIVCIVGNTIVLLNGLNIIEDVDSS